LNKTNHHDWKNVSRGLVKTDGVTESIIKKTY